MKKQPGQRSHQQSLRPVYTGKSRRCLALLPCQAVELLPLLWSRWSLPSKPWNRCSVAGLRNLHVVILIHNLGNLRRYVSKWFKLIEDWAWYQFTWFIQFFVVGQVNPDRCLGENVSEIDLKLFNVDHIDGQAGIVSVWLLVNQILPSLSSTITRPALAEWLNIALLQAQCFGDHELWSGSYRHESCAIRMRSGCRWFPRKHLRHLRSVATCIPAHP